MQRRKFIASIGSVAAGAAAVTGTGAFTSVEASRDVSIETAGDANAFLGITRAGEGGSVTPNAQEYVDGTADSGTLSIDFTDSEDTGGSADGINENAKTIFDNLLDIRNNGSQEVNVFAKGSIIADNGGSIGVYAENTQGNGGDNSGFSPGNPETLSPGDAATNIGIYIPKGQSSSVSDGTLTFVAEKTGGNQD